MAGTSSNACVVPMCVMRNLLKPFFFRQHSKILSGHFQFKYEQFFPGLPTTAWYAYFSHGNLLIENSQKLGIPTP